MIMPAVVVRQNTALHGRLSKASAKRMFEEAHMLVWNDERVELLKKLWAEGLSASQIAGRLGDVTRNAVIGKVHRLGLSGRVTTSRVRKPRPAAAAAAPAKVVAPVPPRPPRVQFAVQGNAALKPVFVEPERAAVVLAVVPAVAEERAPRTPLAGVDLLDLKETMCRWPVGDPQDDDFHFCGQRRADGLPYCEQHARIAFQPVQRRRQAPSQIHMQVKKMAAV
jgi:GcrA cell cycle regulator